jgi:hypothetical protein
MPMSQMPMSQMAMSQMAMSQMPMGQAPMGQVPMGAGSVVAAGATQYVPVPVVTVPDYRNPPQAPPSRMPQPPQPMAIPAYSPPPPNLPANGPGYDVNAFTQPSPQLPAAMTSNGFGAVTPAMPTGMPQSPYGGMPPGAYPQQMMGRPSGPQAAPALPPSPTSQPSMMAPRTVDPALQRAANANAPQAMNTLRTALLPSEREMAVSQLAMVDWRANSGVVQVLVAAALEDPAPTVRAASVRALAQMNVNTVPVYTALQRLRSDGDPRVLQELEQALAILAPGLNGGQDVQQAGMQYPR